MTSAPAASSPCLPKLAIVSTFDELCGIAAYTKYLVKQLEPYFDVTVFELDQYLLRNMNRHVRKLGDASIREICEQLKEFDAVNIQLEHGTIGMHANDISRRLRRIVRAAPRLSISFHTIMAAEGFNWSRLWELILSLRWGKAYAHIEDEIHSRRLGSPLYSFFRAEQKKKDIHFIVHTRRDYRFMTYINRLKNVHHHPLSFLSPDEVMTLRSQSDNSLFPALEALPENTHLIGVFGFMGRYKGFDTVIKALGRLPENYHLAIFGGVHPNEIKRNQRLDPYIKSLFDAAHAGASLFDDESDEDRPTSSVSRFNVTMQTSEPAQLFRHPKDISQRIHFMGSLPDDQFLNGMSVCDSVVLPYLEVGQSSSGPLSQAVELGCRVFGARNQAFLQFDRYHPGRITFFDIGNYVELAEKIRSPNLPTADASELKFNTLTNSEIYRAANT